MKEIKENKEMYKDDHNQNSTENSPIPFPGPEKKKKSPLYKFFLFANLMTIPALAFYFYVGLNGQINGYFIVLILMILSEYLFMRRNFKD